MKGARALAERGAFEGIARGQVERALAGEMGRYGLGSAVDSGLRAVASRARAMTLENVGLQSVPALNRADDLAQEKGGSVLSHVPQAALESAKGLVSLYDPGTPFDSSKSPAERAQSAIALLGAGLAGYGRLRALPVDSERVNDLIERGDGAPIRRVGDVPRRLGVEDPSLGTLREGKSPRASEFGGMGPYQRAFERLVGRANEGAGQGKGVEKELFGWRAMAQNWVKTFSGTKEDFFRLHRPILESRFAGEAPTLTPDASFLEQRDFSTYPRKKVRADRNYVREADLEEIIKQTIGRSKRSISFAMTAADQAKIGDYSNPEIGAWASGRIDPQTGLWYPAIGGGLEGMLRDGVYGDRAWTNSYARAKRLREVSLANNGLLLPIATHPEAVLSSPHGGIAAWAELTSSLRSDRVSYGKLLKYFQDIYGDRYDTTWKETPKKNYPDPDAIRSMQDAYRVLSDPNVLTMPHRQQLIRSVFNLQQDLAANYNDMTYHLSSEATQGAEPGDVLGIQYVDPNRGLVRASPFEAYDTVIPGVGGGLTHYMNVRHLLSHRYAAVRSYLRREAERAGRIQTQFRKGKSIIRWFTVWSTDGAQHSRERRVQKNSENFVTIQPEDERLAKAGAGELRRLWGLMDLEARQKRMLTRPLTVAYAGVGLDDPMREMTEEELLDEEMSQMEISERESQENG